jgi:hypothetical protein
MFAKGVFYLFQLGMWSYHVYPVSKSSVEFLSKILIWLNVTSAASVFLLNKGHFTLSQYCQCTKH